MLEKFNRKDYVKIAVQNWLLNQDIPAGKRFSFELWETQSSAALYDRSWELSTSQFSVENSLPVAVVGYLGLTLSLPRSYY